MSQSRNSVFELIRIFAMIFIVLYHLLIEVYTYDPSEVVYKTAWLPLHIGVLLFVLISGYFGIKCSLKGLGKLLFAVALYYFSLLIINGKDSLSIVDCLFVSHSTYWFIRTYICLYLFSPVLNRYLEDITPRQRWTLILSLLFISVYIGTSKGDISLSDGKNLVNFSLIYVIGNTLKFYKDKYDKIPITYLLISYFMLNIFIVVIYYMFHGTSLSKVLWILSFPYCSPLLILNAILFFMIMSKFTLHSKLVNYIASSMLAVYLIHSHPCIAEWIKHIIIDVIYIPGNVLFTFVYLLLLTIVIIIASVVIDKVVYLLLRTIQKR